MPNWKKVVVSGSDALLNTVTTTGDIVAGGDVVANNYIVNSTVTNVTMSFSSGSTIFGDTNDDTHQFTGSVSIVHTGSGYGFELSGSSFYIDAGSSGSVYLGTHNVGVDVASIFSITGSGLIVSQSGLPANHYNMVKIGDVELIDYNDGVLNPSFLIDTIDKTLIISASNTNNAVAQFGRGDHDLYGDNGKILEVTSNNITIGIDSTTGTSTLTGLTSTIGPSRLRVTAPAVGLRGKALPAGAPGFESASYVYFAGGNQPDLSNVLNDTSQLFYTTSNVAYKYLGGAVTASAVSSSGNLFASLSEDNSNFNTVMYDTSTGQFYYTGSYGGGGGGGGTPGGVQYSVQYNDPLGTFGGESAFLYNPTQNYLQIKDNTDNVIGLTTFNNLSQLVTGDNTYFIADKATPTEIFALFEPLNRFFLLQPRAVDTSASHVPSARLHVLDDPVNISGYTGKFINQNRDGVRNLLLGTRSTNNPILTSAHKFIDFQHSTDNDFGTALDGGIWWDPINQFGLAQQAQNTVVFQGLFVSPSDRKLKKNITNTKKGIDDVMSFKVRDFRWKENDRTSPKVTGFIAQEVAETHPELVRDLEGTLNLDYQNIVPLLVKAIQDQQEQINELKKQLENK
jgi:hypothetical protein